MTEISQNFERSLGDEQSISILREALTEAQATIRAYDTKAQIVGVGYIFSLRIVTEVEKLMPTAGKTDLIGIVFAWFIVILPILLFGFGCLAGNQTCKRA